MVADDMCDGAHCSPLPPSLPPPPSQGRAMYDEITARQAAGDPVAQRISFTMSAHAPYTVSDESFLKVKAMSEELDVPVHVHLHETADECHASEHGAFTFGALERCLVTVSACLQVLTE